MNNSPTQLSDVLGQEHGLSESACSEGLREMIMDKHGRMPHLVPPCLSTLPKN